MAKAKDLTKLYPHQEAVLPKISNGRVLWGGVGAGKSKVAAAYYVENELPRPVIVITTAKKRDSLDWQREFIAFGIGTLPDADVRGVLTVDSWNNLYKYKDVKDAFFIFDEQRVVGSGEWSNTFIRIARANHWILLSATPGDTWLDYIPVFLANGFYKNRTEFKRKHVVYASYTKFPKVERYIEVGELVRLRNQILVEMPYQRHTTRHLLEVATKHNVDLMKTVQERRWHIYEERPLRDIAEMYSVSRKLVNSDPHRFLMARQLLKKHPKLIVFYSFDYELEILRELREDTTVAEWNGHKHEAIPRTDSWVYLVQYVAGAEGWNCVDTNAVLFYSLQYSYKIFEQAQGRIDRLNTPFNDLYYYYFKSKSWVDRMIWASLVVKETFNEKRSGIKW